MENRGRPLGVCGNIRRTFSMIILASFIIIICFVFFFLGQMHINVINSVHKVTPQVPAHADNHSLMVYLIGGLGNHLWIYASAYGIGRKTGRKPIACIGYDIRKVFSNISMPMYTYKECKGPPYHPNGTLHIGQRHSHLHYELGTISMLKESKNPHAFLCCYLQNLGFFLEYESELRAEFVIRPTLQSRAQDSLRMLSAQVAKRTKMAMTMDLHGKLCIGGKYPLFVLVHVRRGNMLKEKYVAQPCPKYFNRAMDYYRKKYGKTVVFYVASDDVAWCKANIIGDDVYFTKDSGSKSREDEFAIGVACNHTVMSVGMYGWWMGFLSGGEVVYFKDWAINSWKKWYHADQYFPHNWKPM